MAGLQSLVDTGGSCGAQNPLVKLSTHFTQDKSKRDQLFSATHQLSSTSGIQRHRDEHQLVEEFLVHQNGATRPPQTFDMGHLLNEVQQMNPISTESTGARRKANYWTDEFLHTKLDQQHQHNGVTPTNYWAEDYLKEIPYIDDFQAQWRKSATDMLAVLDKDSTFSESEFKKYVEELSCSESSVDQLLTSGAAKSVDQNWVEEFHDLTDGDFATLDQQDQRDFWNKLESEWQEIKSNQPGEHPWLNDFNELNNDVYKFQEDNQLKDTDNCLEEGKKKLLEGDLPSAVLLFEAAVQNNTEDSEAWFLLGTSQAKNEQDPLAIVALKKSLVIQPDNLTAIMALAASFTNESMQSHACHCLQDWINVYQRREDQQLGIFNKRITSSFMSRELHQQTIDMFLNLARNINEREGHINADVQSGLGILFNLSGDYDKAVDCFKAALQVNPDDPLLWNRLGATLANGDRSEEAIGAYHKALELYPGFVRSRYNLGISCINLKAYREAADHFLVSLSFQAAGRGPKVGGDPGHRDRSVMSENIWSSLRLSLGLLGKRELYPLVEEKNLEALTKMLK